MGTSLPVRGSFGSPCGGSRNTGLATLQTESRILEQQQGVEREVAGRFGPGGEVSDNKEKIRGLTELEVSIGVFTFTHYTAMKFFHYESSSVVS